MILKKNRRVKKYESCKYDASAPLSFSESRSRTRVRRNSVTRRFHNPVMRLREHNVCIQIV